MDDDEDAGGGVPEWVVTFGDMMSLLLTFFIMLVSMSEVKKEEQFQAMVESIRRQFGYSSSRSAVMPGPSTPRNSMTARLATEGRARRRDIMAGGTPAQAPFGDEPAVQIIRPGSRTAIGGVLYFRESQAELTAEHREALRRLGDIFRGQMLRIEVAGHTSLRPVRDDPHYRDNLDLAYARARVVMQELVNLGVDPRRFRLKTAGRNEPYHRGTDPAALKRNPRVEVYLVQETADLESAGNAPTQPAPSAQP